MPQLHKYTDEILKGKKFNALTFIRNSHRNENHVYYGVFQCDCGNEIVTITRDVVVGRKKSCSCYAYRKQKHSHQWRGYEEINGTFWNRLKNNAKTRGIEVEIPIEYAWKLFLKQNRKCIFTGENLFFSEYSDGHEGNASLDRIDSTKGYIEGNVQWVHKDINYIRRDLSVKDFIEWCKKVTMNNP